MTDLQRIVDEIRFSLQASVCEMTENLRATAGAYAAACHEANERLRRCDDLLHRNLRSEAIHLAEADPNLLDVVATLDFPERQEWLDVAALYDAPEAEPLLLDVAQDLNQAYTAVQPLEKLLTKHRLLALCHAPLALRIGVMRQLGDLDPDSFFWDDDLRTFERARFEEIDAEAKEAARRRDVATLESLGEELRSSEWREDVPAHIVGSVRRLAGSVTKATGAEQAVHLTEELEAAFQELDLDRARKLRAQWLAATTRAKLAADDPLRDRIEPILGWVADEDARDAADRGFASAVASLDRAMEGDTNLEDLQKLYHTALRFERTLPESTNVRFQNRTSALAVVDQRMRRLKIGLVAAAGILVAALAGYAIHRHQTNAAVAALVTATNPLIDSGSFEQARSMLKAKPELAGRPELMDLEARLASEEQKDGDRRARFQAELAKARDAASYSVATAALKNARENARFEPETIAVEELEESWNLRNQADLAEKEQAFQKQFEEALRQLAKLQSAIEADPESKEAAELLEAVALSIGELKARGLPLRKDLGGQVELLAARHIGFEEARQAAVTRREKAGAVTSLSMIYPEAVELDAAIESFSKSLSDYSAALGKDSHATQFMEVLADKGHWSSALAWQHLMKGWAVLWPTTMDDVKARIDAGEEFLKSGGNCPEAADAMAYLAALKAIRAREVGDGQDSNPEGLTKRLRRNFNHDLIADAWILTTTDGKTLYVDQSEDLTNFQPDRPVAPKYRIGFLAEDTKRANLKAGELSSRKPMAAPQNKIAKFVRDRTSLLPMDEWDSFFVELTNQILDDDSLDGFLKYDLLKRVLETGSAGSVFFKTAVAPQLDHLNRSAVDPLARWMDPNNTDANKARVTAVETLKSMPELGDVPGRVEEAKKSLETGLRQRVIMIGWLEQVGGKWVCQSRWKPDGEHDLVVCFSAKPDSRAEWRKVGDAGAGGLKLSVSDAAFLKNGRPVFAATKLRKASNVTTR